MTATQTQRLENLLGDNADTMSPAELVEECLRLSRRIDDLNSRLPRARYEAVNVDYDSVHRKKGQGDRTAQGVDGFIEACLMARGWFEGNPENALAEIEHRARSLRAARPTPPSSPSPVERIDFDAAAKPLLDEIEECSRITAEDLQTRVGEPPQPVESATQPQVCGAGRIRHRPRMVAGPGPLPHSQGSINSAQIDSSKPQPGESAAHGVEEPKWVIRNQGCPCHFTTPCADDCSCISPFSSAGCSRCCTYGSDAQRRSAAERIAATLAQPLPSSDLKAQAEAVAMTMVRVAPDGKQIIFVDHKDSVIGTMVMPVRLSEGAVGTRAFMRGCITEALIAFAQPFQQERDRLRFEINDALRLANTPDDVRQTYTPTLLTTAIARLRSELEQARKAKLPDIATDLAMQCQAISIDYGTCIPWEQFQQKILYVLRGYFAAHSAASAGGKAE